MFVWAGQTQATFYNKIARQPFVLLNLLKQELVIFPISHMSMGFSTLIALMNQLRGAIPRFYKNEHFPFSSA